MHEPLSRVVAALGRHGCDPRERGPETYDSRCPLHNGSRRNLSITVGDLGGVVMHCHHNDDTGHPTCPTADIVAALGLGMNDLYNDETPLNGMTTLRSASSRTSPTKPPRKVYPTWEAAAGAVAYRLGVKGPAGSWTYTDAHGEVVMVVVRFNLPGGWKEFRPISPTSGEWFIGQPGGLIPLFNLPDLARCSGDAVYVVEGEKCAEALGHYMPFVTTSPFGAGKASKSDWTPLAGKVVAIVPDNDAPARVTSGRSSRSCRS